MTDFPVTIERPKHYRCAAGYEVIDVVETYHLYRNWHLSDAFVYVMRAPFKDTLRDDLIKARFYLRRFLELHNKGLVMIPRAPRRAYQWRNPVTITNDFGLTDQISIAAASILMATMMDTATEGHVTLEEAVDALNEELGNAD